MPNITTNHASTYTNFTYFMYGLVRYKHALVAILKKGALSGYLLSLYKTKKFLASIEFQK